MGATLVAGGIHEYQLALFGYGVDAGDKGIREFSPRRMRDTSLIFFNALFKAVDQIHLALAQGIEHTGLNHRHGAAQGHRWSPRVSDFITASATCEESCTNDAFIRFSFRASDDRLGPFFHEPFHALIHAAISL